MKRKFLFLILLLPLITFADGGGERGSGGDSLICEPSKENELSGIYSLDYFLTRDQNDNDYTFPQFSYTHCEFFLAAIQKRMEEVDKLMGFSLNKYLDSRKKRDNLIKDKVTDNLPVASGERKWVYFRSPTTLNFSEIRDIPDEEDQGVLYPKNCRKEQAVIRTFEDGGITYRVNRNLMEKLEKRPRQCSDIYIHEWLRDSKKSAKKIRHLNRYLHSKEFFEGDSKIVLKKLSALGLFEKMEDLECCKDKSQKGVHPLDKKGKVEELYYDWTTINPSK